MKNSQRLIPNFVFVLAIIITALTNFSTTANGQFELEERMTPQIQRAEHVEGVWKINEIESDDLANVLDSLLRSLADKALNGQIAGNSGNDLSPLLYRLNTPEYLVLASDIGRKTVTVNEVYSRSIETRSFQTDGAMRPSEVRNYEGYKVNAIRMGDFVRIETESSDQKSMTETYTVLGSGEKLFVTYRFYSEEDVEVFNFRRVYDRSSAASNAGPIMVRR